MLQAVTLPNTFCILISLAMTLMNTFYIPTIICNVSCITRDGVMGKNLLISNLIKLMIILSLETEKSLVLLLLKLTVTEFNIIYYTANFLLDAV